MSIQNVLVENKLDLFCNDLTVGGDLIIDGDVDIEDISISGTLDMEFTSTLNFQGGSEIAGTANFNNTSLVNFSTGSLAEGAITIGNLAVVTLNGGSSFNSNGIFDFVNGSTTTFNNVPVFNSTSTFNDLATFNNNINVPSLFYFKTQTFNLTAGYSGNLSQTNVSVTFYRLGNMVCANIHAFSANQVPAGSYFIDISPATDYLVGINYSKSYVTILNGDTSVVAGNATAYLTNFIYLYSGAQEATILGGGDNGLAADAFVFYQGA